MEEKVLGSPTKAYLSTLSSRQNKNVAQRSKIECLPATILIGDYGEELTFLNRMPKKKDVTCKAEARKVLKNAVKDFNAWYKMMHDQQSVPESGHSAVAGGQNNDLGPSFEPDLEYMSDYKKSYM